MQSNDFVNRYDWKDEEKGGERGERGKRGNGAEGEEKGRRGEGPA